MRRGESRYILAAIPFLAVVAAVSLDRVGPSVVAALLGLRRLGRARHLTRLILLTLLVAVSLDPTRLVADAQSRAVPSTWVQALADRAPNDVIVSFAPTLTSYYLGRTDFWVRTEGYTKYVWAVTFAGNITICDPNGVCYSPRPSTTTVYLEYATGAFRTSDTFSAGN